MMPLYYLHIRDGDKLEVDPDGTELPDIDAARIEALKVAQELLYEVPDFGRQAVIEIADGEARPSSLCRSQTPYGSSTKRLSGMDQAQGLSLNQDCWLWGPACRPAAMAICTSSGRL
jgi:hypothetical protein